MANKYTVHAGHAAKGHLFTGASGFCEESVVDRIIKDDVIKWLKLDGNMVVDCTVDSGTSQSNIISKIKKKINAESNVTANISIHLNALKKSNIDGKTKGVECCVYSAKGAAATIGARINANIAAFGLKNRGNKVRTDLGVLKGITNGGANVLVECFFCDDEDDYRIYLAKGSNAFGKAIAEGIVGHTISAGSSPSPKLQNGQFVHNGVDYSLVFDPEFYRNKYKALEPAFATMSDMKAFEHFCVCGMNEKRQAHPDFNVLVYKNRYPDLQDKFGNNYPEYYRHYCLIGHKEGREAI